MTPTPANADRGLKIMDNSSRSLPSASHDAVAPSAAHTPGPWLVRPSETDDWGWVKDGRNYVVAMARNPDVPQEGYGEYRRTKTDPFAANARLIAAAPDLLANERKNLSTMEWTRVRLRDRGASTDELDTAIEQTRAAIAKAVGTSEPAGSGEAVAKASDQ